MLLPWVALDDFHTNTVQLTKGAERKHHRLAEEQYISDTDRAFRSYGRPLTTMTEFKYISCVLTVSKNY